jgi:predicted GIY-YIG superfamily endonuclease
MTSTEQNMNDDDLDALIRESAKMSILLRKRMRSAGKGGGGSGGRFYTYVLLLQDDCIYVGSSNNIYTRMMDHFFDREMSSIWVREHGPVARVLEITKNAAADDERYKTLEYMTTFGFESVRGDSWCKLDLRNSPAPLAEFKRDRCDFEYMSRSEIDEVIQTSKELYGILTATDQ